MAKMSKLQPQIKRLQEKHKNDRETLNREMMGYAGNQAIYEHGLFERKLTFLRQFQYAPGWSNFLERISTLSGISEMLFLELLKLAWFVKPFVLLGLKWFL